MEAKMAAATLKTAASSKTSRSASVIKNFMSIAVSSAYVLNLQSIHNHSVDLVKSIFPNPIIRSHSIKFIVKALSFYKFQNPKKFLWLVKTGLKIYDDQSSTIRPECLLTFQVSCLSRPKTNLSEPILSTDTVASDPSYKFGTDF